MPIAKINDSDLLNEKRYHITQPDVPGLSAEDMKNFMDNVPREVIIPKINEIVDGVNEVLSIDEAGGERCFIAPAVDMAFFDGFYFNATTETLTDVEGLYSSGTEYHLMDLTLENGSVKPIYIRSNYSGSYSIHPDLWQWNTDIYPEGPKSTYVSMTGFGKVTISAVSELALKYVSVLPAFDPSVKFTTQQYVDDMKSEDKVIKFEKNGSWYCRTWSSGIKECWATISRSYSTYEVAGHYVDAGIDNVILPTNFLNSKPAVFLTGDTNKIYLPTPVITDVSNHILMIAVHATTICSGTIHMNIYCIGE